MYCSYNFVMRERACLSLPQFCCAVGFVQKKEPYSKALEQWSTKHQQHLEFLAARKSLFSSNFTCSHAPSAWKPSRQVQVWKSGFPLRKFAPVLVLTLCGCSGENLKVAMNNGISKHRMMAQWKKQSQSTTKAIWCGIQVLGWRRVLCKSTSRPSPLLRMTVKQSASQHSALWLLIRKKQLTLCNHDSWNLSYTRSCI